MLVILLEALAALVLLLLIVWWTMFHGRRRGELPLDDAQESTDTDEGARHGQQASAAKTQGGPASDANEKPHP